jgi:hypothetical protein
MAARDLLTAATARSTGAELVVPDSDSETDHLTGWMAVIDLSGYLRTAGLPLIRSPGGHDRSFTRSLFVPDRPFFREAVSGSASHGTRFVQR